MKNQSNTTGIIKYLNIVKYQRIVTSIAKDQSIAISIVILKYWKISKYCNTYYDWAKLLQ